MSALVIRLDCFRKQISGLRASISEGWGRSHISRFSPTNLSFATAFSSAKITIE